VKGIADQLSLLDLDGSAAPEARKSARNRPVRQRTTQHDKGPKREESDVPTPVGAAPALLTTEESAALLRVHPRTVQRLVGLC
jgi:hypothetical protein